jgi:hypothetical protein
MQYSHPCAHDQPPLVFKFFERVKSMCIGPNSAAEGWAQCDTSDSKRCQTIRLEAQDHSYIWQWFASSCCLLAHVATKAYEQHEQVLECSMRNCQR